ncbi:MAG: YeeE/YedE family protein [Bacillota bacterium]
MLKGKIEFIVGVALLAILLILGSVFLTTTALYFRLVIGLAFGYTMARASYGFAGSANRAFGGGSTRLMQAMIWMFFGTAAIVAAMATIAPDSISLSVKAISGGLFVGAFLFGLGMSWSMCCASGVLTDLAESPSRAILVMFFFGVGVIVGQPIMSSSFVTSTLISYGSYNGVFFPSFFEGGLLGGYLGGLAITGVLCLIAILLAKKYEAYRRANGTFKGIEAELNQDVYQQAILDANKLDAEGVCPCKSLFDRLFVNPWSLGQGAVLIMITAALMFGFAGGGWGFSTTFGQWTARILNVFGLGGAISGYTGWATTSFTGSFITSTMNIQNSAIFFGALIALLMSGKFLSSVKASYKISGKDAIVYIVGGFVMGFATRVANGCNGGALYTPIASFSLSGWIFFAMMVLGSFTGTFLKKLIYKVK